MRLHTEHSMDTPPGLSEALKSFADSRQKGRVPRAPSVKRRLQGGRVVCDAARGRRCHRWSHWTRPFSAAYCYAGSVAPDSSCGCRMPF